ncbi:MAG: septum formation initiator family protein [Paludibacter sp.]|nr:septum formation initiator family protein [Paludibacter sp.]
MSLHRITSFLGKVLFSKYTIVAAVFLVYLIFFDDHNLIKKYGMRQEIKQLETELSMFREDIEANKQEVERLKNDSVYLEKVARENYLMKKDNEDIFLFNETTP